MNRIEIVPERGGAFQDPKPRTQAHESEQPRRLRRPRQRATPATSSIASSRASGPTATSRRAIARPPIALLANIALATKARLDWDAQAERFTNNDAANELLDYEYRKPWSQV